MTPEPRGFDYPLDPVHKRARNAAERAAEQLTARREALAGLQRNHERLELACRDAADRCRPLPRVAIDPIEALARARYLTGLQLRVVGSEAALHLARTEVEAARGHVLATNVELRKFDEHRKACLAEYAQHISRREQVFADQDWLARCSLRSPGPETHRVLREALGRSS